MSLIVKQEAKRLPKSAVQLTVTISKDAAKKEYAEVLGKIAKEAAMPGFRKGKVPTAVLEKKFGEGIRAEALQSLMDKALHEAFDTVEIKPITYSTPRVVNEKLELDFDKDLEIKLEYDTLPEIKLGNYKNIEIEEPQVSISKKDEDRELEHIREQNSMVIDKASGIVAKGDTVTVNFVELGPDGEELPATKRQDFVFTLGSGYNYYKFDDELLGLKKDQEQTITKTYPDNFEAKDLAGKTIKLKVLVTSVKEKKLPDLNDDLAQDVSDKFKTLDDLRASIRERLEKSAESKVKQANMEAILEKIAQNTPFDVPESMIQAEMEQNWRTFAAQSRMTVQQLSQILGPEGQAKMFETWKPESEKALRHRLIMEKIIEVEKFEATEAEVEQELVKQAESSRATVEETREYFQKNQIMHYLEHDVKDRKLQDFLFSNSKIKKGKKTEYLDLMGIKE